MVSNWLVDGEVDIRASPLREQRKPVIDEFNPMTVANVAVQCIGNGIRHDAKKPR